MKLGIRYLAVFAAGGICIIAFLYYLVVLSPALAKRESLDRSVEKMRRDLSQMQVLKSGWESFVKSRSEAEKMLQQRGKDFTLLTYLEGVCRQVGIEGKIQYMKPMDLPDQEGPRKPVGIEMRLSELDIRHLVQFLYRIENSGQLLSISKLKIRPSSEEGKKSLEITLQVNTCT